MFLKILSVIFFQVSQLFNPSFSCRLCALDDDSAFLSPSPRRRSLTLESHSNPFSGTAVGRQRRQSLTFTDAINTSGASTPCDVTQHVLHSSLAGNLNYYQHKQRRCFIDVSYFLLHLKKYVTQFLMKKSLPTINMWSDSSTVHFS